MKSIRKAVRCFILEKEKVLVIQYREGNKKQGFYDIPGGKIEEGETAEEAVKRECKEETGIDVLEMEYKGIIEIEYPDRIFEMKTFLGKKYEGRIGDMEENSVEWIEISTLLEKQNVLSNIVLLKSDYIQGLKNGNFRMRIEVTEKEEIVNLSYQEGE